MTKYLYHSENIRCKVEINGMCRTFNIQERMLFIFWKKVFYTCIVIGLCSCGECTDTKVSMKFLNTYFKYKNEQRRKPVHSKLY